MIEILKYLWEIDQYLNYQSIKVIFGRGGIKYDSNILKELKIHFIAPWYLAFCYAMVILRLNLSLHFCCIKTVFSSVFTAQKNLLGVLINCELFFFQWMMHSILFAFIPSFIPSFSLCLSSFTKIKQNRQPIQASAHLFCFVTFLFEIFSAMTSWQNSHQFVSMASKGHKNV